MENEFKDDFIPEKFHINSVYIYLRRAPTPLAKAPVYSLQIFNGGEVIYTGEYNVEVKGKQYEKIDEETVFEIIKKAINSDFFSMRTYTGLNDNITMDGKGNVKHHLYCPRTDMPVTTLEIRIESKTKIIRHWGSCSELDELESFIDVCCVSDQWTGCVDEYLQKKYGK